MQINAMFFLSIACRMNSTEAGSKGCVLRLAGKTSITARLAQLTKPSQRAQCGMYECWR